MANLDNLTVAQQQTRGFLSLLDPEARTKTFHFRTFDDKKGRSRYELIGNKSSTIDRCEEKLRQRNAKEAGVFVVINDGGHTDKEITKVRAVFADTDGAPLKPIVDALAPHAVICSSPGKYHVYWLVDDNFPLDRFTMIQKAIAKKFGTDPMVCNLSRVMRLPGFAHNKHKPFDVHFHQLNHKLPRYSVEQMIDGLRLHEPSGPAERSTNSGPSRPQDAPPDLLKVECMLMFIKPWSDRKRWMDVIFALADEFGEAGRDLAVRWSRGDIWWEPNI
jgi:hypothetical protein